MCYLLFYIIVQIIPGVRLDILVGRMFDTVVNCFLLKCRKLRREDQETSDSIVGFFIEKPQCDVRLQSSKSHLKSFLQGIL